MSAGQRRTHWLGHLSEYEPQCQQKWLRWSVLTIFLGEIGRNRFYKGIVSFCGHSHTMCNKINFISSRDSGIPTNPLPVTDRKFVGGPIRPPAASNPRKYPITLEADDINLLRCLFFCKHLFGLVPRNETAPLFLVGTFFNKHLLKSGASLSLGTFLGVL